MATRLNNITNTTLPPRIRAAFSYLEHVRWVTTQWSPAITTRDLSKVEKSVESAALRALQQYLLGEMDFSEDNTEATAEGENNDSESKPPDAAT